MTTYYFKLIAYNSAGEGPLSGLFAVKTAQGGKMRSNLHVKESRAVFKRVP